MSTPKKCTYLCSREPDSRCEVLVNVELIDGHFPPIIEWRNELYYWKDSVGGYYRWGLKDDVMKVSEKDIVEFVTDRCGTK